MYEGINVTILKQKHAFANCLIFNYNVMWYVDLESCNF